MLLQMFRLHQTPTWTSARGVWGRSLQVRPLSALVELFALIVSISFSKIFTGLGTRQSHDINGHAPNATPSITPAKSVKVMIAFMNRERKLTRLPDQTPISDP